MSSGWAYLVAQFLAGLPVLSQEQRPFVQSKRPMTFVQNKPSQSDKILAYVSWIIVVIAAILAKLAPSIPAEVISAIWLVGIALQICSAILHFSGTGTARGVAG
jgi:hypothetical protein